MPSTGGPSQRVQLPCQYGIRSQRPYSTWSLRPSSILLITITGLCGGDLFRSLFMTFLQGVLSLGSLSLCPGSF